MKIFIDFDDVLLNTNGLKKALALAFEKKGVSQDFFIETYKKSKIKKRLFKIYHPEKHLMLMAEKSNLSYTIFNKIFWNVIKKSKRFIFNDAKYFLAKFKKDELFLISFGANKYQREKIDNSGLQKYFKKIIMANNAKAEIIKLFCKKNNPEEIYFIDDRIKFIQGVKMTVPQVKTILLSRKEGRFQDRKNRYCDYAVKNLRAVLKIIKTKSGK